MATHRSLTCKECGTINEPNSVWCDCGWSLDGLGERNDTAPRAPRREGRSTTEQIIRAGGFFFTLAPLRFVSSVGEGGPVAWLLAIGLSAALVYMYWRFVWRE